jgi:hypothetical protein
MVRKPKSNTKYSTTFSIDKIFDLFSREKRDDTIKSSSNVWNLKLTKDIPLELDIRGGATDQNIELGGLRLTFFKLTQVQASQK